MGTGILQCWEGNRDRCGGGVAIPSQQDYNKCESGPIALRERWALRSCVYTGLIIAFTFFISRFVDCGCDSDNVFCDGI